MAKSTKYTLEEPNRRDKRETVRREAERRLRVIRQRNLRLRALLAVIDLKLASPLLVQ